MRIAVLGAGGIGGPDGRLAAALRPSGIVHEISADIDRMLWDLEDGRRVEVDALSGAVAQRGRRSGVPTPVHQTITACRSLPPPAPAATQA